MPFVSFKWLLGVLLPNLARGHPPQTLKKIGSNWIFAQGYEVFFSFHENWTVASNPTVQNEQPFSYGCGGDAGILKLAGNRSSVYESSFTVPP